MSVQYSDVLVYLYIFRLCFLSGLSYVYIDLIYLVLRSHAPAFLYILRLCVLSYLSYIYLLCLFDFLCACLSLSLHLYVLSSPSNIYYHCL